MRKSKSSPIEECEAALLARVRYAEGDEQVVDCVPEAWLVSLGGASMRGSAGVAIGLAGGIAIGLLLARVGRDSTLGAPSPTSGEREPVRSELAADRNSTSPSASSRPERDAIAISRERDAAHLTDESAQAPVSSVDPRSTQAVDLSVIDAEGRAAGPATIVATQDGEDGRTVRRYDWSPAKSRIELPLGRSYLHAEWKDDLRSSETIVRLSKDEATRRITLRLVASACLRVHVRRDGGPVIGFEAIALWRLPRGEVPGLVDALRRSGEGGCDYQGHIDRDSDECEFARVEPGRYLVQARASNVVVADRVVDLAAGSQEIELELAPVAPDHMLRVFVTDARGQRLGDVLIDVVFASADGGGGSFGIDGDGCRTASDGALQWVLDDSTAKLLDGEGERWLEVRSPDHESKRLPLVHGQREYHVALADELCTAVVVRVDGAATHRFDGLFKVGLRHPHARGGGWSEMSAPVGSGERALFERVAPAAYEVVLYVRSAGEGGAVPVARRDVTVDSGHAFFEIAAPPLYRVEIRGRADWAGTKVTLRSEESGGEVSIETPADASGGAVFFGVPAGRYLLDSAHASRSIAIDSDIVVDLSK
jgi:hypothetical protein